MQEKDVFQRMYTGLMGAEGGWIGNGRIHVVNQ